MYEPVVMSKRTYDKLKPEQQKPIMAAAQKAQDYFTQEARKGEKKMIDAFTKAGVEAVNMSKADLDAGMEVHRQYSYKHLPDKEQGVEQLLQKALSVAQPLTSKEQTSALQY